MARLLFGCLTFALVATLPSQQIDSVDLTRPQGPSQIEVKRPVPAGCKEITGGGIADGFVLPEDHRPRQIVVEVLNMIDVNPILGGSVEAVVSLSNSGTQSIEIPWSTDPDTMERNQHNDEFHWEGGTFDFTLTDQDGSEVALKSLTERLYGSQSVPGSQLTIQPGQSIAAVVKFKLEDLYPIEPLRLREGEWQLSVNGIKLARVGMSKTVQHGMDTFNTIIFTCSKILPLRSTLPPKTKPNLM